MPLSDTAYAKINLSLTVLGRRADGFHELGSVVAFARYGDRLTLTPGGTTSLTVEGPFATALAGDNLILKAAGLVCETWPTVRTGAFHLTKNLPVAAGIGGGSADAAAALRLLAAANPTEIDKGALPQLAEALGADVPVCLSSRAAMMRGLGEQITPLSDLPAASVALVNPGVQVATRAVFDALGAPALSGTPEELGETPRFDSLEDLAGYLTRVGNDLEETAVRLFPVVGEVKSRLRAAPGCHYAGMSGSGATCFGLFGTLQEARNAASDIAIEHAGWWVQAALLQ